jgi:hypothetical protein
MWNSDDVELPKFDELTHAEIGKWAIFKVKIFKKKLNFFFIYLLRKQMIILIFILLLNFK